MDVTVIGGAGRTGSAIVDLLEAGGHDVTVMSRRPSGPRAVQGSITDPEAVAAAVGRADGVVVVVESDDAGEGPNGPRRVHTDGVRHVLAAAPPSARVVLVTQIYVTRPERLPDVREVIDARREGEALLRRSGRTFAIVRPGWLRGGTNGPVRLKQGDTGEGSVSRANVAAACVAALVADHPIGVTFEIFDDPGGSTDWPSLLAALVPDERP